MTPYVIMSPDWDTTSGGIRVMWGLFGWLLAKGQVVHMNRRPEGKIIAIYPEIVQDNPAEADTVVRYILNKPGVMSSYGVHGQTEFGKNDILIGFSKLFIDKAKQYLFLPILDLHTFKDQGKERTKICYFVGKGTDTGKHPPDAILIDRQVASDQQRLADILNECQVMYDYDPVSAMTEIARLCGCKVKMINDTYSKQDYDKYEPGKNGLSWGDDDIPLDVKGFRSHYIDLKNQFSVNLDKFITLTQDEAKIK